MTMRHVALTVAAVILSAGAAAQTASPIRPGRSCSSCPTRPAAAPRSWRGCSGARLEQRLGKPFVIENRPGAATAIGATFVAKSVPDGHTLLLGTSTTMAINVSIYKSLSLRSGEGPDAGGARLRRAVHPRRQSVAAGALGRRADQARRQHAGRPRLRVERSWGCRPSLCRADAQHDRASRSRTCPTRGCCRRQRRGRRASWR